MAVKTLERTDVETPETEFGFAIDQVVGGKEGEGGATATPEALVEDQTNALQEADRLIEDLKESYRNTAMVLRALDSILARL